MPFASLDSSLLGRNSYLTSSSASNFPFLKLCSPSLQTKRKWSFFPRLEKLLVFSILFLPGEATQAPYSISWPLPDPFHLPWLLPSPSHRHRPLDVVLPPAPMHCPFFSPRFLTQVVHACCLDILPTLLSASLPRAPTLLIPLSPRSLMICFSMASSDLFCYHSAWPFCTLEFLPLQDPCQYNLAFHSFILKCMNSLRLYATSSKW